MAKRDIISKEDLADRHLGELRNLLTELQQFANPGYRAELNLPTKPADIALKVRTFVLPKLMETINEMSDAVNPAALYGMFITPNQPIIQIARQKLIVISPYTYAELQDDGTFVWYDIPKKVLAQLQAATVGIPTISAEENEIRAVNTLNSIQRLNPELFPEKVEA